MAELLTKEEEFIEMFNKGIIPEPDGLKDTIEAINNRFPEYDEGEREGTDEEHELHDRYKALTKEVGDKQKEKKNLKFLTSVDLVLRYQCII